MTDILVPFEQEGTKAVVRGWLKRIGDRVEVDDPLVELETDKVTQEVHATLAGVLTEILLAPDAEAVPGAILGRLSEQTAVTDVGFSEEAQPQGLPARAGAPASAPHSIAAASALSPSVRRAVRERGLDPAAITGTGRKGRITRADVDRVAAAPAVQSAAPADLREAASPAVNPQRDVQGEGKVQSAGGVRSVTHDRMRLAIAQNMLGSVTAAPHVTAVFECDLTAITAHRLRHKAAFEAKGAKLTFTTYFIAASVQAMRVSPFINSRWFDDRLEIFDDVGVGVGTALGDEGLVVPVVQRAQTLSLLGVATALTDLTGRARARKLVPADMRGGTFTISNHGVSGSLLATPIIINQPQSAILGVGKLEKRVVVREIDGTDAILIRPMCYVSLTIDHRAVDGHQANAWLTRFVSVLESWPADA